MGGPQSLPEGFAEEEYLLLLSGRACSPVTIPTVSFLCVGRTNAVLWHLFIAERDYFPLFNCSVKRVHIITVCIFVSSNYNIKDYRVLFSVTQLVNVAKVTFSHAKMKNHKAGDKILARTLVRAAWNKQSHPRAQKFVVTFSAITPKRRTKRNTIRL